MGIDEEVIIVGRKPVMNYVLSAVVLFNQGISRVIVKGKGEDISKAVDVANSILERLGDTIKVKEIKIGSENRKGKLVSFISVILEKII